MYRIVLWILCLSFSHTTICQEVIIPDDSDVLWEAKDLITHRMPCPMNGFIHLKKTTKPIPFEYSQEGELYFGKARTPFPDSKQTICYICYALYTKKNILRHFDGHYICQRDPCNGLQFSNDQELQLHKEEIHGKKRVSKTAPCYICGVTFGIKKMQEHAQKEHGLELTVGQDAFHDHYEIENWLERKAQQLHKSLV